MKIAVQLVLFIFISFLSVPTIVTMIEKNTDVSVFYNFAEEEITKHFKEVKAQFKFSHNEESFAFIGATKNGIISEKLSKHDKVLEKIFSPPPKFI
ncbi:hypothetical protein [Flavobacterium sp.]|uniref:hypothetical protein n=1 Tax=Flavobacterium sp. TaxID=239 RepID=UPI002487AC11|nr:hypothetical protein [Flavobacterium sp.]MDI1318014.1 hypothetical protein [Flavobacterium sp.]